MVRLSRVSALCGVSQARDFGPGMAFDTPGEFEFEQDQLHRRGGAARLADEFIDRDRRRPEQFDDGPPIPLPGVEPGGRRGIAAHRFADHPRVDRPQRLDHIVDRLDQRRAFADQSVYSSTLC